jgi:uncharacterized protein
MALFEKVFKSKTDDVPIEEFLNSLDEDDDTTPDADALVKPMVLNDDEDSELVVKEAKAGNIVLLNIESLAKRNAMRLREMVTTIKGQVAEIDGDIARISHDRILITPSKVKIVKKKEAMER